MAIIGNEDLLQGRATARQVAAYVNYVKGQLPDSPAVPGSPDVPVTVGEPYQTLFHRDTDRQFVYQDVIDACSVILVHYYPSREGIDVDDAVAYVHAWHEGVKAVVGDKPVIVGETGWPSGGAGIGEADPTPANAAAYFKGFVSWAEDNGGPYFYFEAFDENWKAGEPGGVGVHWGIRDSGGQMKGGMQDVFAGRRTPDNWTRPAEIELTRVPPIGVDEWIEGRIRYASPLTHDVAVYIKVDDHWWTKPTFAEPLLQIDLREQWSGDAFTHPNDVNATDIAVFLWPVTEGAPPRANWAANLPPQLDALSASRADIHRLPLPPGVVSVDLASPAF